jgi:hypothetical protein
MDAFQMMHMHCWVCALFVQLRTFLGYIVFDIKTLDHTNDSLFKRVTKDTKLNTPEQQL